MTQRTQYSIQYGKLILSMTLAADESLGTYICLLLLTAVAMQAAAATGGPVLRMVFWGILQGDSRNADL